MRYLVRTNLVLHLLLPVHEVDFERTERLVRRYFDWLSARLNTFLFYFFHDSRKLDFTWDNQIEVHHEVPLMDYLLTSCGHDGLQCWEKSSPLTLAKLLKEGAFSHEFEHLEIGHDYIRVLTLLPLHITVTLEVVQRITRAVVIIPVTARLEYLKICQLVLHGHLQLFKHVAHPAVGTIHAHTLVLLLLVEIGNLAHLDTWLDLWAELSVHHAHLHRHSCLDRCHKPWCVPTDGDWRPMSTNVSINKRGIIYRCHRGSLEQLSGYRWLHCFNSHFFI